MFCKQFLTGVVPKGKTQKNFRIARDDAQNTYCTWLMDRGKKT